MSLRYTGSPCGVLAERLVVEVDVHRPGDRVGDAQRRRGQVVHLHVRVDAALEVAVARQHRDDRQVLGADDLGDLLRQRPAVADAGRAAVADEVEAELVQVLGQPGAVQVLGDDLRARGQRGLDPRLDRQPLLDGVAGQESRRPSITDGFDVLVQLVMAAITTWPWSSSVSVPSASVTGVRGRRGGRRPACRRCRRAARGPRRWERAVETGSDAGKVSAIRSSSSSSSGRRPSSAIRNASLGLGQRDPVLRALGAGDARDHLGQVELDLVGVRRLLGVLVVPEPLLLGVGLDERDQLLRPAGELQVAQRLGVDREDRARRAELRRHVADRRPVGERQPRPARRRRTRRTCRRRRARAASR